LSKNIDYNELRAPQLAGVYKIENKFTNKVYIGESVNIGNRIARHIEGLVSHSHDNVNMQEDYDKCGITDFKFSILQLVDQDKINKTDLVNYLLYMESAYYRKFEKSYNLYNIVVPYQAITECNVSVPFYDIDFDKVKELLNTDPYNIEYEKIEWAKETIERKITLEEILNNNVSMDADTFIKYFPEEIRSKLFYLIIKTKEYNLCQVGGRRNLLCAFREMRAISDFSDTGAYYKKAYVNVDSVGNKFIYQNPDIEVKTKGKYLDMTKPIILCHDAQRDVVDYLSKLTDEMYANIDKKKRK